MPVCSVASGRARRYFRYLRIRRNARAGIVPRVPRAGDRRLARIDARERCARARARWDGEKEKGEERKERKRKKKTRGRDRDVPAGGRKEIERAWREDRPEKRAGSRPARSVLLSLTEVPNTCGITARAKYIVGEEKRKYLARERTRKIEFYCSLVGVPAVRVHARHTYTRTRACMHACMHAWSHVRAYSER